MTYIDQLQYREFSSNKEKQLQQHEVVNFDITHYKSRGDPPTKTIKTYKKVITEDFNNYPEFEVQDTVNCI